MTADTIREALHFVQTPVNNMRIGRALAALTELEQQAAAKEGEWVRKPMWDAMLARAEAAEADRDRLADTLREIVEIKESGRGSSGWGTDFYEMARAALDRQEQT